MKVVLLNHVKGLGQKGEVKEVSEGYFRNMLAPKRLAALANAGTLAQIQNQHAKAIEKLESLKESAESVKKKLEGQSIELKEKVGDSGSLYAAVSIKEVLTAIRDQLKVEVPSKAIQMDEHIKSTGEYPLTIKLHKDVSAQLKLKVLAQ